MGKIIVLVLAVVFGLVSPTYADETSSATYHGDCLDGSKVTITILRTNRIYRDQDFFCNELLLAINKTPSMTKAVLNFSIGSKIVSMYGNLNRNTNQMAVDMTVQTVIGSSQSRTSNGVCLFSYTRNRLSKIQCGSNSVMLGEEGANTEIVVRFDVAQE